MMLPEDCSQLFPGNVCSHNTACEQTKPCERPLMSLWCSPRSTHPLSTSWYKQKRGSLNKATSFTPKPTCTTTACQCYMGIQSPGNGLTPKTEMLSACRPEEELGRTRSIAGQDGRVWPHFLMGDSQEWEKEAVFLSGPWDWCIKECILSSIPRSSLSHVHLDSGQNN